jgi:subtilisin family serine protease
MTLDPSDRFLEGRRQRTRDQMDHLQRAHADDRAPSIIYDTGDPADFNFICAADHVLLERVDPDAPPADPDNPEEPDPEDAVTRLRAYLGRRGDDFEEIPPQLQDDPVGLARRFFLPARTERARVPGKPDVLATLDEIDQDDEFGVGFARPNHVVHICSQSSICPATEPAETGFTISGTTPAATAPLPPPTAPWPNNDHAAGNGVDVLVVDTGWYEPSQEVPGTALPWPWLKGVSGEPEVGGIRDLQEHIRPYAGHGTFVAGVVRAMASQCDVEVLNLAVDPTVPGGGVLEWQLVAALDQVLLDRGQLPDLISMSAGCTTRLNQQARSFEDWYADLERRYRKQDKKVELVFVAAAGNNSSPWQFWPASFPWAIGVGSLDRNGQISDFSNWGDSADVFALGRNIINAFPNGIYVCHESPDRGDVRYFDNYLARWSGTSFSTPLVTGLIAAAMNGPQGQKTAQEASQEVLRTPPPPPSPPTRWSLTAREVPVVADNFLDTQS